MKIKKCEQSGFVIENEKGFRLAFDIGAMTPFERFAEIPKVDAFIASHIHGDHFHIESIKALSPQNVYLNSECIETLGEESFDFKITTIKSGETITVDDMQVSFFDVDHGPNVSTPVKENFGFLITCDNKTIYFAGDMFYASGIDVTDLEVDYALLPVGTFYTFGPRDAFDFAKKFKKIGILIPMHYEKMPDTKGEFLTLAKDNFVTE